MKELLHLPRDCMRKIRRAGREYFFPVLDTRDGNLKLPLALFIDSAFRAPASVKVRLVRQLIPYLFAPARAPAAEICVFPSLTDFESSYARLAVMLGHPGKTPPPGEIEFLRAIMNRPMQYPGTIPSWDNFFLTAFVSILAPPRVVEIGTLTGFSAAMIAAALRHQSGEDSAKWVDTIDHVSNCFIDKTRPTGFEIAESFPELASMIRVHSPHDSTIVSRLAQPEELDLVFIDADHQHPFPLLDLLRVAPYMKPGAWVLLHDIQLGTKARNARGTDETLRWGTARGAELLFESWPFRKIAGGNIGAVQLPKQKSGLVPFALRLMSVPSEIKGSGRQAAHRALHQSFEALV